MNWSRWHWLFHQWGKWGSDYKAGKTTICQKRQCSVCGKIQIRVIRDEWLD